MYKYKVVESIATPGEEDKFDVYVFVVRTRIGKYLVSSRPTLPDDGTR